MIKLSYLQKKWLTSRGGRTEFDVDFDTKGLYILMSKERDSYNDKPLLEKYYLPNV